MINYIAIILTHHRTVALGTDMSNNTHMHYLLHGGGCICQHPYQSRTTLPLVSDDMRTSGVEVTL